MEDGRKQLDEIETEASELNISKETRTGVQFSLLMSRIFIKHEKYDKAYQCATDALEIAKSKSMQTEITMLEQIISKAQERSGSDVSSSLNSVVVGREDTRQHVPH